MFTCTPHNLRPPEADVVDVVDVEEDFIEPDAAHDAGPIRETGDGLEAFLSPPLPLGAMRA